MDIDRKGPPGNNNNAAQFQEPTNMRFSSRGQLLIIMLSANRTEQRKKRRPALFIAQVFFSFSLFLFAQVNVIPGIVNTPRKSAN